MELMNTDILHWEYYITLEGDLLECRRYVEFHSGNMNTYSIEFVRLLLSICSEIDVLAKAVCQQINPKTTPQNITDYRNVIEPALSLSIFKIEDLQTQTTVLPFNEWAKQDSPSWWKDYNAVKHDRRNNYQKATLNNSIYSLAGLFTLNVYHYHRAVINADLWPESKFFKPSVRVIKRKISGIAGYQLPHVEKFQS
jgi:hypothetical protein